MSAAHRTGSCSTGIHMDSSQALALPAGLIPCFPLDSALFWVLPSAPAWLCRRASPCSLGSHLALQVSFQQPEEPGPGFLCSQVSVGPSPLMNPKSSQRPSSAGSAPHSCHDHTPSLLTLAWRRKQMGSAEQGRLKQDPVNDHWEGGTVTSVALIMSNSL